MGHALTAETRRTTGLVDEHLHLAERIASRLKRRYVWIAMDELYSYAMVGLLTAAQQFEHARGVPFATFAWTKGMFGAIDEMRRDGLLRRQDAQPRPKMLSLTETDASGEQSQFDLPDESVAADRRRMEARDTCEALLGRLGQRDRALMLMYYADDLTLREIALAQGVSEATVCLRHKAILVRLREILANQVC